MLGEFDIIRRFFDVGGDARSDVVIGIGDDAAILRPPEGELAMAVDGIIAFSPDGARVIYRADSYGTGAFDLYSVPVDKGLSARLSGPSTLEGQGYASQAQVTPDGATAWSITLTTSDPDTAAAAYMAQRIDAYTGGIALLSNARTRFVEAGNCSPFLLFNGKCLVRNLAPMFDIIGELVLAFDFSNIVRLKSLILEYKARLKPWSSQTATGWPCPWRPETFQRPVPWEKPGTASGN